MRYASPIMGNMSTAITRVPASTVQRDEVIDLLAGLVAVMLLLVVFLDMAGTLRLLLALLFTFFVPGRAIVSNWPRMADWSGIGMSIVLSLGPLTAVATIALWIRAWHPIALFEVEAVLSLLGLGVAVARRRLVARGV
jgi:hypothetical protein